MAAVTSPITPNQTEEVPSITTDKRLFVSRAEWEAGTPSVRKRLRTPAQYVVFSYTNSKSCENKDDCIKTVKRVYYCQIDGCGLPDIKYNFMIGGDGRVYEGRGWQYTAEKYAPTDRLGPINGKFIEISFLCPDDEPPTKEMSNAAAALIREGISKNLLTRDVKATTIWSPHAIPTDVKGIQRLRISRHVGEPSTKPFSG